MNKGFTLIEVLIALVILGISFTWLIVATNQSIDSATRSKFITTSTLLAQKRIAEVSTKKDAKAPGSDQGDFGEDYPGYTYTENIESTPLEGCYKYTLTLKWGDKGNLETEFLAFLSSK